MLRASFRDAPYIGSLVRNQIDAEKDRVVMFATPAGVEIQTGGSRYVVPYANVKSYQLA